MLRLTGEVVRTEARPWAKDGRAGVFRTARVVVGRADFQDVNLPDGIQTAEGEVVDWAVEPGTYAGRLQLRVMGDFCRVVPGATPISVL